MKNGEPIVILDDRAADRSIILAIGPYEASALLLELESLTPPRPLVHDLMAFFFTEGGFALDRVELFGEAGSAPKARLEYRRGLRTFEKEVRPADALTLAIRLGAPIFAPAEMLESEMHAAATRGRPTILDFAGWKAGHLRA